MENPNQSKQPNISHFQKLAPVNLEFQDLSCIIQQGRKDSKVILKSLSGHFRSGQLTAIMGSSGSGKTTLLNVLSGYKTVDVDGTLTVNGRPVVLKEFLELSRYIMQEHLLQSFLTVQESMIIAADLKLNKEISQEDKSVLISEILDALRLISAKDTLSNKLSGGERRRLSIALELINNPPVLFLDEPTTGLDDLSSSQCISLLKSLAEGGRTVICSIHAPSARMFEKFDNVYVMSQGLCVYQGYGTNVISFLSQFGLSCPKHYNPADFVIEVTCGQYGDEYVDQMSTAIENGRNGSYCKDNSQDSLENSNETNSLLLKHPNECFHQFKILLYRRFLQMWRNKQHLLLKVATSIMMGIFLGSFYFNMGQDASKSLYNITYPCVLLLAFIYLTIMPICLYLPPEIKLLQSEHFNRWYGLPAYYLAMSVATVPMHLIMLLLCFGISYAMSAQPMEFDRFILVILIGSLATLVTDSHAVMICSVFNITNGLFAVPVTLLPLIMMCLYGMGEGSNMSLLFRIAMYFSYVRLGFESMLLAIYGNGRSVLECPEEETICVLRDPKKVISFAGFQNTIIWINIIVLVIWYFIFRIVGFYLIRLRLQSNNPIRFVKSLFQKYYS